MAVTTSISGLQAAQQEMGVISDNIANGNTSGFKRGDLLFAELYSASLGFSETQPGTGVAAERTRTDFSQGGFRETSSQLDLAIDGDGLFIIQSGGDTLYTRAGDFRLSPDGYVVTEGGSRLQGFPADATGNIVKADTTDLQITTTLLSQNPTSTITFNGNLDSRAESPDPAVAFDATNPATYNFATATTIYDSAGAAHQVTLYFAQDAAADNKYTVHVAVDDVVQAGQFELSFDNTGSIVAGSATELTLNYTPANADAQDIVIDFAGTTGFGATSATSGLTQDGYAAGQLSGFEFDRAGIAYASYTNGETRAVGQVALATFTNAGGLESKGKTNFAESTLSGTPSIGAPAIDGKGLIRPSTLESANVDLTIEMLALIEAQRAFQTNAQAIQNANEAADAVLQLR